jgi:V/A-type H+/Na+-transporting ATPase subunit E
MTNTHPVASGVEALITRLRDEGVAAGEKRADEIIRDAEARALEIVADAKKEAETLLSNGRAELAREQAAGMAAFKVAIRDTRLELDEELKAVFAAHVRRLISADLKDRDFLRQLVLAVAGRASASIPDTGALDILIGQGSIDGQDTRKEPLREFVLGVSGAMLREGVSLRPSGTADAGVQIRLVGEDVEIDLTQKTLSDLILKHLLPRYRKIVEGVD